MIFALVLLFTGCSSTPAPLVDANGNPIDTPATGDEPGPGEDPSVPNAPSMTIDAPAAASYLNAGSNTVSGTAFRMDAVSVNGASASLNGDTWTTSANMVEGMNVLEVIGTTDEGAPYRDIRSALAGSFQAPDGLVDDAVQVYLSADTINAVTPLINEVLDPSALEPLLTSMNPVMDAEYVVNAVGIDFGFIDTTITPSNGYFHLELVVNDIFIPLSIDGAPLGVDEGEMQADALILDVDIYLGADADGLILEMQNPVISFDDFDFDVNNFLANWFISDGDIEAQLLDTLGPLLNDLNPMIADALADLELPVMEAELLETPMTVGLGITDAGVEPGGIFLGLGLDINAVGAAAIGDGHIVRGVAPIEPVNGIGAQVADDFMNRFLHEMWGAGVLDIDMPIEAGGLSAILLTAFGAPEGASGGLRLEPAMPPAWIERAGEARLQLPEVTMFVDTPGGAYGDTIEVLMTVDAKVELALTTDAFGLELSDAQVRLAPRGAAADNQEFVDKMGDLEGLLTIGLPPAVNEMLSFSLVDLGLTSLPPIAIERDMSGLGTSINLEGLDLDSLVPVHLKHMSYSVPVDAMVVDENIDVEVAGGTYMVCDRRTTVMADGIFYVGSEGRVIIESGFHTIYAEDEARIELEGFDPVEIYADPGAEIDDPNGIAIITYPRSVTLDISGILPDGCP